MRLLLLIPLILIMSVQPCLALTGPQVYRTNVDSETHYVGETGWFSFTVECFYCNSPQTTTVHVDITGPAYHFSKDYTVTASPGNPVTVRIPVTFTSTGTYMMTARSSQSEMYARIDVYSNNPIDEVNIEDFEVLVWKSSHAADIYVTPTIVAGQGEPTNLQIVVTVLGERIEKNHVFTSGETYTHTFEIRYIGELPKSATVCVKVKSLQPVSVIDRMCKNVVFVQPPYPPTPYPEPSPTPIPTPSPSPTQSPAGQTQIQPISVGALAGLGVAASLILIRRP